MNGDREREPVPFEYALLRAVPRVDRGECLNVGVVVYCQDRDYLGCAVHLDADRLQALSPETDVVALEAALAGIQAVCAGDADAGPSAMGSPRTRFGWLTAPRSTMVQPSAVHSGMTHDPAQQLRHLHDRLVL